MKKVSKISLHNLSKAGLADKEMNMLRGGAGSGALCWVVCTGTICRCVENSSGNFDTSEGITENNQDSKAAKDQLDQIHKGNVSG